MIYNPKKMCLIHDRKSILRLMKYALAMKPRYLGPRRDAWQAILRDLGATSVRLSNEIRGLTDFVDDAIPEWIIRAKYIKEYGDYERHIEAATNTVLQPSQKLCGTPGQLS